METSRWHNTPTIIKDLLSGYMGGIAYVLSGQPLDIVKVRFQSLNEKSIFKSAKSIWKNEGLLSFWKGSFFPLITVGLSMSILFTANELTKEAYRSITKRTQLKAYEYFLIGGIAGTLYGLFVSPIEHVKVRMQIQKSSKPLYRNSIDCANTIVRKYGVKALFKGTWVTLAREFIGCGVYFMTYFCLKDKYHVESNGLTMLIGGVSGVLEWNAIFALDNLKTKMQTDDFVKPIYRRGNYSKVVVLRDLCKGYLPGMIKAFPANAATFLAYELTGKYLR